MELFGSGDREGGIGVRDRLAGNRQIFGESSKVRDNLNVWSEICLV